MRKCVPSVFRENGCVLHATGGIPGIPASCVPRLLNAFASPDGLRVFLLFSHFPCFSYGDFRDRPSSDSLRRPKASTLSAVGISGRQGFRTGRAFY